MHTHIAIYIHTCRHTCTIYKIMYHLYEDVADGVNVASPVRTVDVHKIPPTPTSTFASSVFQNAIDGKNTDSNTTTHIWSVLFDILEHNSMAIPEVRSRRNSREQRDQPSIK